MIIDIYITNLPEEILDANPDISNAIPNDSKNDADAIQAAIDYVTAQRKAGFTAEATIHIPSGIFDLESTINMDVSGITIKGEGQGASIIQNADSFQVGTKRITDSGTDLNSINRDAYLFNLDRNADNVAFTNITLSGPEIHGAIFGLGADDLDISAVEFNNFMWSSLRLFNLSNATIRDNVFIDAGGQAKGTSGPSGGSIYATYLKASEIYNNDISRSGEREGNVYGIKGRQFTNTRIHHNTINTNFAIELPFENDKFVEIDHNFLDGVVSIPKFKGGLVLDNGFTFHIHHNYFTRSYSLELPRNSVEIDHNVFVFDPAQDGGNLISRFGNKPAPGPTKFHNNLILNPGRGIFWSAGIYNNLSFYNNEVIANKTATPRTEGLFGFNSETDFSTVEIKDNVIKVNGVSRPLVRNEASYRALIENNTLTNVSDVSKYRNPDTGAPRGLLEPLSFQVGAGGEFAVEGPDIKVNNDLTVDPNQPAVANDDTVTIEQGDSITIDVLGNDFDPEGDLISLAEFELNAVLL